MESPRSRYIKGHGFSSSSKRPFSSFKDHVRSSKHSKHSRRLEVNHKSKRRLPSHELPLHLKRPFKISTLSNNSPNSSLKRDHTGTESNGHPSKHSTSNNNSLKSPLKRVHTETESNGHSSKISSSNNNSPNSSFKRARTGTESNGHSSKLSTSNNSPKSPLKRAHTRTESNGHPSKNTKVGSKGLHGLEDILRHSKPSATLRESVDDDHTDYKFRFRTPSYIQILRRKKVLAKTVKGNRLIHPLAAQKGMHNPGVRCYRNSLFQSLLHQPKFVNWILLSHRPEDCVFEESLCVACVLRNLAISYCTTSPLKIESDTIAELFTKLNWSARDNQQADPDEQLVWILNQMSRQVPKGSYRQFEAFYNTISDNSINCRCGHSSVTPNHVSGSLSIDLNPRAPGGLLTTYLDQMFNSTVSGYKCSSCGDEKYDKTKTARITHLPDLLVLTLKRFSFFSFNGEKDSVPVKFTESLNLDRFRARSNKERADYSLSAVVAHCGSINSGHYVAAARCEDGGWRRFDDRSVVEVRVEEVLGAKRKGGFTPYLLFYQRREGKA